MFIPSWSAAAAGNYAYALCLDVKRDVSVAPGGVLSLTSNLPLQYTATLTTPRVRRAWASPKFFFLLRLNRQRMTYLRAGFPTFRLTYVPAYQRSGLPTYHQLPSYLASLIVHLQFKRNTYLSLLCDWIFLCLQNYFSFLSSKFAVEACDVNNYC